MTVNTAHTTLAQAPGTAGANVIAFDAFRRPVANFNRPAAPQADPRINNVIMLLRDLGNTLPDVQVNARQTIAQAVELLDGGGDDTSHRLSTMYVRGGLAPWQARRIEALVEAGLGATIRVEDMAKATRLSSSYFTRAFRVSFGCSPHRFVMDQRLRHAQKMMTESREPLSQIALICGFSDQAHFSRAFARFAGSSPMAWRRCQAQAAE
jgi:transcriptional regulator GlxA family with amidase domain